MTDQNLRLTRKFTSVHLTVGALVAYGAYACGQVSSNPDDSAGGSGGSLAGASSGSAGVPGSGGSTAGNAGSSGSGGSAAGDAGSSGSGGNSGNAGSSGAGSSGSAGSGGNLDAGPGDAGNEASPDAASLDGGTLLGNLISNPDFELGVLPWTAYFGGTLSATTEQAHSGLQSAKLTGRTQGAYQGVHYDLTDLVTPGASYAVTAFARIANGATNTATLKLTARIKCSTLADAYQPVRQLTGTDSSWTDLSGTLVVPTSDVCDLVEILLYVEGPPINYDLYVDDVSVTAL